MVLDLTICSVYHSEESKKLLRLNHALTLKLNQGENFTWIVGDNTPAGFEGKLQDPDFLIVPGADQSLLPAYVPKGKGILGSYVHAAAINRSLKHAKSRFVMILDVDFFIVRPNWIRETLRHMQKEGLAFLGAPWHPRWWKKFRYFPAHHALLIDSEKIKLADLDFLPQYTPESYALRMRCKRRACIGRSLDTGYALYEKYYKKITVPYECFKPVFRPYTKAIFLERWARKAIKTLVPDNFLYIPKKNGYFVSAGFRESGYYDASSHGWEEFMWQESPFGFHMRGAKRKPDLPIDKITLSKGVLNDFLERNLSGGAKL